MFFCKSVLQDGVTQKLGFEPSETVLVGRVASVVGAAEVVRRVVFVARGTEVVFDVVPAVLAFVVVLQTFS